ncbi:subunit Sld5 of DNA replication complex GINS complex [Chloropicon primus]|nr:subunit Sld5 of DNA replication complex GINS complex [Chloropicon primus]
MEPSPSPLDGGAEGVDLPPDSLGAEDFAPFNGGAGDNVANDAQLMRQAWINECLAPEILMYKEDIVDRTRTEIARQEKIVEDYEQDHANALTRMIRLAEVNRIKFSLRSYLRKRLSKIEAYAIHFFANDELSSRLSPQEHEFAKEYIQNMNDLFQESILKKMPRDYDSLLHQSQAMESEVPDMIPEPHLDKHVFVKVTDDLGDIRIDRENSIRLAQGDIFAIRYNLIKEFVDTGRVELI